jgi:cytochrome bd-type quinol oxidase subunit 1
MNYPVWDLPGSGLLVAAVAILHVFVAHFAIGGGLFLVVAERRARRQQDAAWLAFVRDLSRVFVLLTLVFGALTGVGIWFTIGLVHPAATSSLIAIFVWVWAIEWTFFVVEIAAALVYAYGWERLDPGTHLAIGWIYFAAAWLSLAVINGILSFMLTPGAWLVTRGLGDAFFNPTYWPSLAVRTLGAMGLAGLGAVVVALWRGDPRVETRVVRRRRCCCLQQSRGTS